MTQKLVVFDFCDTITNFQTGDAFVRFVSEKHPSFFNKTVFILSSIFVKLRFFAILNKLSPKRNHVKRFHLWSLKGQTSQTIAACALAYFEQRIRPNYHAEIMDTLRNHVSAGDIVVVSSGGYDPYLTLFCKQEKIAFLNCTKIAFKNNKCLGVFDGPDCMFDQKVRELEILIQKHNWLFDERIVYSDSITDMPLFQWADQAYVVSKNKSQPWAVASKFHEIIIRK